MPKRIQLSQLAEGAIEERFNLELPRVLDNLMDRNTDYKKPREIQITLKFTTNEERDLTVVDVQTKTKLAPASPVSTKILMDRDNNGNAVGAEFIQARLNFDEEMIPPSNVTSLSTKTGGRER